MWNTKLNVNPSQQQRQGNAQGSAQVGSSQPGFKQENSPFPDNDQQKPYGGSQSKNDSSNTSSSPGVPSISLPKGGGAIRGMGEKWSVIATSGSVTASIPVPVSTGRNGFQPSLSLNYDSNSGNGPFGIGWQLSSSSITRRTDKGLPLYCDEIDSDTFILSGSEDLVPVLEAQSDGTWKDPYLNAPPRLVDGVTYRIRRFTPRIGALSVRIERWTNVQSGDSHWRTTTGENVTTTYGIDNKSRIFDPNDPNPDHPTRVFTWLADKTFDDRGNVMIFEYKSENSESVDLLRVHEETRSDTSRTANRYLKRIKYGNTISTFRDPDHSRTKFLFEIVFDYGDHDKATPTPAEQQNWVCRRDPLSVHRAGFEIRSYRLCQRILLFHHFPNEDIGDDCLVASVDLSYRKSVNVPDDGLLGEARGSFISSAVRQNYKRSGSGYDIRSFPPLDFVYTIAEISQNVIEVDPETLKNIPSGLAGETIQWVDLNGEGISGMLSKFQGGWMYKSNLGNGKFGTSRVVSSVPSISSNCQLIDLDGDGNVDWVDFSLPNAGFFKGIPNLGWEEFHTFRSLPNLNWNDKNIRFLDLTGDSLPDVFLFEGDVLTWYQSLGVGGFGGENRRQSDLGDLKGPRLIHSDVKGAIFVADMTGDGLTDIVKVGPSNICYWPNQGYGRFGSKVTMSNCPIVDDESEFNSAQIRLIDVDGSGTTDIIYLQNSGAYVYFNECGNSWSSPSIISALPVFNNTTTIQSIDLLGNGTACLVWSSPLPSDFGLQMKYIDLMGGTKPHLLSSIINNMGAETKFTYSASPKFYLQDKANGFPWITSLPFPVHVVERVDIFDRISRNHFTSRYEYHHGHYDGREREFCGFGRVDQYDTENYGVLQANASNSDATSQVPPLLTKTWFHTGQYFGGNDLSYLFRPEYYHEPGLTSDQIHAMFLSHSELPMEILHIDNTTSSYSMSTREVFEASRALKGAMIRQEVFALDATAQSSRTYSISDHPYSVSEHSHRIYMTQPRSDPLPHYGVFFAISQESVIFHYDRQLHEIGSLQLADPRVEHHIALTTDIYGQELESLTVAYGRRREDTDADGFENELKAQFATSSTYSIRSFTNIVSSDVAFRLPKSSEARSYEIKNLAFPAVDNNVTSFISVSDARKQIALASDGLHDLPYEDIDGVGAITNAPYRRLINHARVYYRSDDLTARLPLGTLESMALTYHTLSLAFTPSIFQKNFINSGKLTSAELDSIMTSAKYVQDGADANFWLPSGLEFFSPDTNASPAVELSFAHEHFYTIRRHQTPFHTPTFNTQTIVDFDEYDLIVTQTKDPVDNYFTIGERDKNPSNPLVSKGVDYRLLQPKLVMDPNRNRIQVSTDIRGFVVGTAIMGKPEEMLGDNFLHFEPDISDAIISAYYKDPMANAQALLGSATNRNIYNIFAFMNSKDTDSPQPASNSTIARETHVSDLVGGAATRTILRFQYSDGFSREIQAKSLVAPGQVPTRDATGKIRVDDKGDPILSTSILSPRWNCSGWRIINNKGQPVKQYEPFFTDTNQFEFEVKLGVSPTIFYDPVGRVIAVLTPNHLWSKIVFDPWKTVSWDTTDTLGIKHPEDDIDVGFYFSRIDSSEYAPGWLDQRINGGLGSDEQKAASKSMALSGTPTKTFLDVHGKSILGISTVIADYSNSPSPATPAKDLQTFNNKFDIEGHLLEVKDTMKRICASTQYDLLGKVIYGSTMDGGERWSIFDIAGNPVFNSNSRGYRSRYTYDQLRRPLIEYLVDQNGREYAISSQVYGDSRPNPELRNWRTKMVSISDQAGTVTTEDYDFKGSVLKTTRQLSKTYDGILDWSQTVELESDKFVNSNSFDAFGRSTETKLWDNTSLRLSYDEGGALLAMDVNLQGVETSRNFVRKIEYNAKGQRTSIEYGNDTMRSYTYDRLTWKLTDIVANRLGAALQNLHYVFDAGGNIVYVKDTSQQTLYFRNEIVTPDNEYTYDSIGRLIEATGREHLGQNSTPTSSRTPPGAFNDFQTRIVSANDNGAVATYLERYKYDIVGNIQSLQHIGSAQSPGWTRTYDYSQITLNNRLTSTTVNGLTESYGYGGNAGLHGNMTSMPHVSILDWNFKDQLQTTAKTIRNDGGSPEKTWYSYEGGNARVRKVTERQSQPGQPVTRARERIYLGAFEIYREYGNDGETISLERTTLNLQDADDPLARVDTRTKGSETGIPQQIIRYQLTNHIHSTSVELDENGKIASYEEYTPFGSTSYQMVENDLEVPKIRRWNYKERDEENGFFYCGARYYAPWICRWTSADPTGIGDGLNVFSYVSNNPIMRKDPTGHSWKDKIVGAVTAKLGDAVLYSRRIINKAQLAARVEKDHIIARSMTKIMSGPLAELHDAYRELTYVAEAGKTKWHTIKSTLEGPMRKVLRAVVPAGKASETKTMGKVVENAIQAVEGANAATRGAARASVDSGQIKAFLSSVGNIFEQATAGEAGRLAELLEKNDMVGLAREMKQIIKARTARELLGLRNQLLNILKSPAGKAEIKALLAGSKEGAKASAGKLHMQGIPIALGILQYGLATNDQERADAVVETAAWTMIDKGMQAKNPMVTGGLIAGGVGMLAGEKIDHSLDVSTYMAKAGVDANVAMREHGFGENASNAVGLVTTVVSIPFAFGESLGNKFMDWYEKK